MIKGYLKLPNKMPTVGQMPRFLKHGCLTAVLYVIMTINQYLNYKLNKKCTSDELLVKDVCVNLVIIIATKGVLYSGKRNKNEYVTKKLVMNCSNSAQIIVTPYLKASFPTLSL